MSKKISIKKEDLVEFPTVFNSILQIAALIAIGSIVAKSYIFNKETKQMYISLITNVAMPSIILSSIFKIDIKQDTLYLLFFIFILSVAINLLGLGLGFLFTSIFKGYSEKRIEIAILSAFGNTGFIGIPLCTVLFGPEGALYAAVFDAGVDFTIWTVGAYLLKGEKHFSWQVLKGLVNIPLLAIVFGLSIATIGIHIPIFFSNLTDSLAAFAVPLAMFFIGAILSDFHHTKFKISYFEVTIPILIKLIMLPLTVIIILRTTNLNNLVLYIVVIQSMMPALTLSSVLFAKYSRDENLGALVTILSTAVSLFIIPTMIYLMDLFY